MLLLAWTAVGLGHCAYDVHVGRMSLRKHRHQRVNADGTTSVIETRDVTCFTAHAIFNVVAWPLPWIVRHVGAPAHDALIARRSPMPDPLNERTTS